MSTETEIKKGKLRNKDTVEAVNEVNNTIKKESKDQTKQVNQTQVNSTQHIVTSIDESSAVSTGGGEGGGGQINNQDIWYNTSILGLSS